MSDCLMKKLYKYARYIWIFGASDLGVVWEMLKFAVLYKRVNCIGKRYNNRWSASAL